MQFLQVQMTCKLAQQHLHSKWHHKIQSKLTLPWNTTKSSSVSPSREEGDAGGDQDTEQEELITTNMYSDIAAQSTPVSDELTRTDQHL